MRAGTFKLLENWKIKRIDKATGEVLSTHEFCNTIVNAGLERIAKLLNNVDGTYFRALAIGTGTTPVTVSDTALETEDQRAAATLAYEADYKATFSKTFSFTGDTDITEAGIFDSTTVLGSTMLARKVFTAITGTALVDIEAVATITIARA